MEKRDREFFLHAQGIELILQQLYCEKDIAKLHILMDRLDLFVKQLKNSIIEKRRK